MHGTPKESKMRTLRDRTFGEFQDKLTGMFRVPQTHHSPKSSNIKAGGLWEPKVFEGRGLSHILSPRVQASLRLAINTAVYLAQEHPPKKKKTVTRVKD